ncbi:ATP-binding protein [Aquisalimonas sp.]|uniref:ATP-binding protein n=1 Tax=Aquisalimonas sp. TaxID=1872621 RepID=UPI0025BA94E9|nr:ATP-binding protein [Aquisalimonas sp.]
MAAVRLLQEARSHPGVGIVSHVLTFAAYLVLAFWAAQFTFDDPMVPLIWPATGLALAAVWRFGYGLGVTVLVASTLAHTMLGMSGPEAFLLAVGNAASAVVGAALLRYLGLRGDLGSLSELCKLLGVGIGVTALFSGFGGALIAVGITPELTKTVLLCWLADSMGVVLLAPLIISADLRRLDARRLGAATAVVVCVPLLTLGIYSGWIPEPISLPLSYAVFPIIILVALSLPAWLAAAAIMLTSLVAIHCTAIGKGPFAHTGMAPDLLLLHAQLALLAATGLILAALRQERLAAEARARNHLHTLARAGRINAMSALAAGIAHEINQPLCALSSYAQSANRLLARGATAEQLRAPLERIVSTADRASDIVRRTRRFLSQGDVETGPADLNVLVTEASELLRPEFRRRDVQLRLNLSQSEVSVAVDWLGMQQVVVNLLQNALEAVDEAGNNARRWVSVRTGVSVDGRQALLSVVDGGPGLVNPDDQSLFEPFTTTRTTGTGLGLAIASSIVEAERGRITVSNEPGAGAHFRISLPLFHT